VVVIRAGLVIVTALLTAACTLDEAPATSTPAPEVQASPTATATAPRALTAFTKLADGTVVEVTPGPGPRLLPPPVIERRVGLWLVDVAPPRVSVLHDRVIGANFEFWGPSRFAPDGTVWAEPFDPARTAEHFAADGSRLPVARGERGPWTTLRCRQPDFEAPRAVIDGREYAAYCGVRSPDGRLMTWRGRPPFDFDVDFTVPLPTFLLDLDTGVSTRLAADSYTAGGDSFWSDVWSPSGAFVILHWYGDRVAHLADRAGNVRLVARYEQLQGRDMAMQWSPREDAYLSPGLDGTPFVEWPATGRRVELPGALWPVRFDLSGEFVYWAVGFPEDSGHVDRSRRDDVTTFVARAQSGQLVARWPWAPVTTYYGDRGVAAFDGAPIGLTELSIGGWPDRPVRTSVQHPLLREPVTLADAVGAVWSPNELQVAFGRAHRSQRFIPDTATTGRAMITEVRWTIEVFDVPSGTTTELASFDGLEGLPYIQWSPTGATLLVQFPAPTGL
jgi:hypothetical protein